jgi:hypothetical protein
MSAVLVAMIGLGGSWLIEHKPDIPVAPPIYLTISVFDDGSKTGLADAQANLRVGGVNQDGRTDSTGRHMFELNASWIDKVALVEVSKTDYETRRIELAIPRGGASKDVFLARIPAQVARVTPQEGPSAKPLPIETATSDKTRASPASNGHLSTLNLATISKSVLAPSAASRPEFDTVTETYRSGPRESGVGKDFSDWYTLCTPPTLPADALIINVSYRLEGDRQCGAWSECRLGETTPARTCFEFRLQGHDEVLPPRTFQSEGFLTITYKRPRKAPA